MKTAKITSVILFFATLLLCIYIGGKQINSKIEETIKNNYESEINALKDKLTNQSNLINSIINIGNKNDNNQSNTTTQKKPSNNTTTKKEITDNSPTQDDIYDQFEYIQENGGITVVRYTGKQKSVQIPNTINQLPVLKISENAFSNTNVTSIVLPSSCKEIDWFAFYGCYALTSVYISSQVTTIGYGAFDSCSKSLTIYCEPRSYAQEYAQSFGINYSNFE
jgi:hypothetical protein